jgi:hypothetical protein
MKKDLNVSGIIALRMAFELNRLLVSICSSKLSKPAARYAERYKKQALFLAFYKG